MIKDIQEVSWPGWETVRVLGRGSFGAVYEIQRDVLGEPEKAALKVISIPQSDSEIEELYNDGYDQNSIASTFQSHLKSIVAEYTMMRKLNDCPNVVHCDDIRYEQRADGIGWDIYIKMELLTPLAKALPEEIPDSLVIKIAKEMCTALEQCGEHNIIHRDIKPQNMFFSDKGICKLGDFGIAKTVEQTMGGTKIGTFKYMAPEVYHNQPYGAAADIYSLGLVLYWLLNERRMPFVPLPPAQVMAGTDGNAANRRLMGEQIPAPKNGSAELKHIVLKACAYNPKDRFASAAEMKQALDEFDLSSVSSSLNKIPQTLPDPNQTIRVRRPPKKQEHTNTPPSPPPKTGNNHKKKLSKHLHLIPLFLFLLLIVCVTLLIHWNIKRKLEATSNQQHSTSLATEPTISPEITTTEPAVTEPSYIPKDTTISAGAYYTVALKSDGTVVTAGNNYYDQRDVDNWIDIVSVQAGDWHTVGLKADGTVVAEGGNYRGQCNVSDWENIVAISAGGSHTVGLKADGTVIAVGSNKQGQCNISNWTDIVAISAGYEHTVGLKSDGTVVATGNTEYGRCDVSQWTNIIAISAGGRHTVGLKSDGTVIAVGDSYYGQCDVFGWRNIVAISAGLYQTVGLRADGTVVARGSNGYGTCDVSSFTEIIAISTGGFHTVVLKADGTVEAIGYNDYRQCRVSDMTNIRTDMEAKLISKP